MAPGAKRKRNDRTYSQDSVNEARPSPHRPQNLGLARANSQQNTNRASRRSSRGNSRVDELRSPTGPSNSKTSPSTMSPPATPSVSKPGSTISQASVPASASKVAGSQPSQSAVDQALVLNIYLTRDRVTAWTGTGRKNLVNEGARAQEEDDTTALALMFEELAQGCLDNVLDPVEIGSTISDILAAPSRCVLDPVSIFLDAVSTATEADQSNPSLRPMLVATGIDPARFRGELEISLLTPLQFVRPTFARVAIRKGTQALYRQSNYNLLREESEGYSKLITEYFTTTKDQAPYAAIVTTTFGRVKALIGAFDLDVGRVLDVTLDVFANLLVRHNRFFVKFLRISSFWPEPKIPNDINLEDQIFSSLPKWAAPNFHSPNLSDAEKEDLLDLRDLRDRNFWPTVDGSGIQAYFSLGRRRIVSGLSDMVPSDQEQPEKSESTQLAPQQKPEEIPDSVKIREWAQKWMSSTHTLPPSGNRIAAQLLGFKLRFYASDARNAHDVLPENLIYLAALLIKIGFISLVDLYPHLYPLDENMPALRDRLVKEKAKEANKGVANNALAMAAALPDDTLPAPVARLRETENRSTPKPDSGKGTPASAEPEKPKLPEPEDQKTLLLRSLLMIGALPEALFILGRFPWLLDVYPDLNKYIFRLLHHSLHKVYKASQPFSTDEADDTPHGTSQLSHLNSQPGDDLKDKLKDRRDVISKQASSSDGNFVPRKTLRWAKLEEYDSGDGVDYRFYWEEWSDSVPVCQTVDDVFRLSKSLITVVGPKIGEDTLLLVKLARIGRKSLENDASDVNRRRWVNLSATLLAPALSFSGKNPGVVNEVFELFKQFDLQTRYKIYTHWFTGASSRNPAVVAKFKEVKHETFFVLKRISTENTKPMARELAKVAYACPGVVFEHSLRQIENYGNLAEVVVECSRYLTSLAYDCLTWTLIHTLSKEGRESVQADGMLISGWLRNAAMFVGKIYKRYGMMSPTPILQFIADQLFRGNSVMLAVLEQLITSMSGIGSYFTLTDAQVFGLNSGPVQRAFTLEHWLNDERTKSQSSSRRLMRALKETGLAAQILTSFAQELTLYTDPTRFKDVPAKVRAANYDNLHSIFAQLLDLLRSNLSVKEFDDLIPGILELVSQYQVDPSVAFMISRESISGSVTPVRTSIGKAFGKKNQVAPPAKDSGGDVVMGDTESPPAPSDESHGVSSTNDVEMKDSQSEAAPPAGETTPEATAPALIPELQLLADQLMSERSHLSEIRTGALFYVTFWQLSLGDIHVCTSEYSKSQAYFAEKKPPVDNRRDVSLQAARKREADRQAVHNQVNAFMNEVSDRLKFVLYVTNSLKAEMVYWFPDAPMVGKGSEDLHDAILQDCFLPRILLSPSDALFCSHMLKKMHLSGVPGFRMMMFLDRMFRQKLLVPTILSCTAREAQNFGRFLADVLKELKLWHADQKAYVRNAHGQDGGKPPKLCLLGFGKRFNEQDRTTATFVEYEEFRSILFKWHKQLHNALEGCLKSGDYMRIRNAINILKAISSSFPVVDIMGQALEASVKAVSASDPRDDLKLAAVSLLGDFKKNATKWIPVEKFHNPPGRSGAPSSQTTPDKKPTQEEKPAPNQKPPDPEAPPFTSQSMNGTAKASGGDVEMKSVQSSAPSGKPATGASGKENPKSGPKPVEQRASSQRGAPENHTVSKDANAETVQNKSQQDHASASKGADAKSSTQPKSASDPASKTSASLPSGSSTRPDSRGGGSHPLPRVAHALPNRPEVQSLPRGRIPERPLERHPSDYHGHGRHDTRNPPPADYGRLDRPGHDGMRDSFGDRREASPGRRRPRTPDRGPGPIDRREAGWGSRDPRDYADERSMRPPPRDARGPPGRNPGWESARDPRDPRDGRELRDRPLDPRGLQSATIDSRSRGLPPAPLSSGENSQYHRDSIDRNGPLPPRPRADGHVSSLPPAADRRSPGIDRLLVNPERAALMADDSRRGEGFRTERRDRGSRPQSPRRADDRAGPPPYQGRTEPPREQRDDRNPPERSSYERHPPHDYPPSRDRRDEPRGPAPTGPRSAYAEPPMQNWGPRDAYGSSHPPRQPAESSYGRLNQDYSQSFRNSTQDPNYGRLNPPSDIIPSGPRGRPSGARGGRNFTAPNPNVQVPTSPAADRPKEPNAAQPNPAPEPKNTESNSQAPAGIHPSRLSQFKETNIQTDVSPAPSGPRGGNPPASNSSPTTRTRPSGPLGPGDRRRFQGLNNTLSQPAPGPNQDRPDRNSQVRGRGNVRAPVEPSSIAPPAASRSHPGTPRTDDRPEHGHTDSQQDENRPEGRGGRHRGGGDRTERSERTERNERDRTERSDRSGHPRTPADRGDRDRRADDRLSRADEQERLGSIGSRRTGGGGTSERESGRRERSDRDREADRPAERRGGDRRERGGREEQRASGDLGGRRTPNHAPDDGSARWGHGGDTRNGGGRRGGGGTDDRGGDRRGERDYISRESRDPGGRKRGRGDGEINGPPHPPEQKRLRRSGP